MPTKQNPGLFDCWKVALPDEPIFVILGRDPAGPATLEYWAAQRIRMGKTVADDDKDRIRVAFDEAKEMQEWRDRMMDASVEGIPPWRLPVHFIGSAEIENPTPNREQYVPVEEAALDAAKRDERTVRLLATIQAALRETDKALHHNRDPWIALDEVQRVLKAALDANPPVAEDPPVAESIPAKPPVIDSDPADLAHAPEVPHHRFSVFHKAGDYAYARGLEVNPMHLPTALDAMAQSGWHLVAIFGATDSQHIGFIFRKEPVAVEVWGSWGRPPSRTERAESPAFRMYMDGRPLDEIKAAVVKYTPVERVATEYAELMANGECRVTRVPLNELPEWTHPCYGCGRGQQP